MQEEKIAFVRVYKKKILFTMKTYFWILSVQNSLSGKVLALPGLNSVQNVLKEPFGIICARYGDGTF